MERSVVLEKETVPFARTFSQSNIPEESGTLADDGDHCVILCKKVGPNVFYIRSGLVVLDEGRHLNEWDGRVLNCPTRIVFVPE